MAAWQQLVIGLRFNSNCFVESCIDEIIGIAGIAALNDRILQAVVENIHFYVQALLQPTAFNACFIIYALFRVEARADHRRRRQYLLGSGWRKTFSYTGVDQ